MAVGEKKNVTVPPAEAYGSVDPKAFQEVDRKMVPADAQKVGTQLEGKTTDGKTVYPRISEVKKETIVLDFNHPLAGKTLHFDVKVLDVAQATSKEFSTPAAGRSPPRTIASWSAPLYKPSQPAISVSLLPDRSSTHIKPDSH